MKKLTQKILTITLIMTAITTVSAFPPVSLNHLVKVINQTNTVIALDDFTLGRMGMITGGAPEVLPGKSVTYNLQFVYSSDEPGIEILIGTPGSPACIVKSMVVHGDSIDQLSTQQGFGCTGSKENNESYIVLAPVQG